MLRLRSSKVLRRLRIRLLQSLHNQAAEVLQLHGLPRKGPKRRLLLKVHRKGTLGQVPELPDVQIPDQQRLPPKVQVLPRQAVRRVLREKLPEEHAGGLGDPEAGPALIREEVRL
jgi:hypothetical protein